MKKIIFVLILGLMSSIGFAQHPPTSDSIPKDSTQVDSNITDHGEAGGIDATQMTQDTGDDSALPIKWIGIVIVGIIAGFALGRFLNKGKSEKNDNVESGDLKLFIDESVTPQGSSKEITAADVKKLKDEIKRLKKELEASQNDTLAYKNNLEVYTNFDQQYYNEAFRKLVSPMNDAMEKGSRKEILESLLKIMSHFSSLTRYKISKKQPYDEANMQYLMNQRMKNDVAVEIDANTPLDKIPKNIKTLVDMLSEQSSNGLDDAIISGYKIKNL